MTTSNPQQQQDQQQQQQQQQPQPFPNLYVETCELTIAAIVIFALADVHTLVARQNDSGGGLDHRLPLNGTQMIGIYNENKELLGRRIHSNIHSTWEYILTDYRRKSVEGDVYDDADAARGMGPDELLAVSTLYWLGNEDDSCCYAITVNPLRKRIILIFRGSITFQDWVTDAKLVRVEIPNPVYGSEDDEDNQQPPTIGVHMGFRDYLFDGNTGSTSTRSNLLPTLIKQISEQKKKLPTAAGAGAGVDGSATSTTAPDTAAGAGAAANQEDSERTTGSEQQQQQQQQQQQAETSTTTSIPREQHKLDDILDKVQVLMEQHPDFHLYICGHSLGGALSVMTSLHAAARFGTPERPVTCIAVANPLTGDHSFRHAFSALERSKKLRCCVVHNKHDLVPLMAPVVAYSKEKRRKSRFWKNDGGGLPFNDEPEFCQQGMKLTLSKGGTFQTRYVNKRRAGNRMQERAIIICCWPRMAEHHNFRLYLDRLVALRKELRGMYLNDLYKKQAGIVHYDVVVSTTAEPAADRDNDDVQEGEENQL